MISENRSTATRSTRMKRRMAKSGAPTHSIWAESNKQGGFIIYAGVKGTDIKTYAGSATSQATLDYNLRKARVKFSLPV